MNLTSANDPVAEIKAREVELMEAKNHPDFVKNPRRILSFYENKTIRLFDLHEMQLDGEQVGEMFAKVSPGFIGAATIHDVRVEAEGNIGFSSLVESYVGHVRDTGEAVTLNFRMSHGWKKIDGQWLIMQEHWSYPADEKTGLARTADPLP